MIQLPPPYYVRPMQMVDLPWVMTIENAVFPTPWPATAFEYEITQNSLAQCVVLQRNDDVLLGYGCTWAVVDEVHVSTLAVAPEWRGRGFGELLLLALLSEGIRRGAVMATLEVRIANRVAQSLYAKYGFEAVGRRKRYYADNQEDALIMTAHPLDEAYQARLAGLQQALWAKLRWGQRQPSSNGIEP